MAYLGKSAICTCGPAIWVFNTCQVMLVDYAVQVFDRLTNFLSTNYINYVFLIVSLKLQGVQVVWVVSEVIKT